MLYGAPRMLADILALGYKADLVEATNGKPFVVTPDYQIELGRFAGRKIALGLEATPDFPKTVASAIHVRAAPHLFDVGDCVPNVRNIQPSALGQDWRYWSKNFGWSEERSARRLISQVNRIFQDA
jgi:hypothetical protein